MWWCARRGRKEEGWTIDISLWKYESMTDGEEKRWGSERRRDRFNYNRERVVEGTRQRGREMLGCGFELQENEIEWWLVRCGAAYVCVRSSFERWYCLWCHRLTHTYRHTQGYSVWLHFFLMQVTKHLLTFHYRNRFTFWDICFFAYLMRVWWEDQYHSYSWH